MSDKNESSNTIEEKRRKNVMDNQKFLQSLNLFNVRDELKSTVSSVPKPRKKWTPKSKIDQSEVRRSSRIKSMVYHSIIDDDDDDGDFSLSTDESSNAEEENDLTVAFTKKVDQDWQPLHTTNLPTKKISRSTRQVAKSASSHGVKIFQPNTGLEASNVISKNNSHKFHVSNKMNVAISSSSEDE